MKNLKIVAIITTVFAGLMLSGMFNLAQAGKDDDVLFTYKGNQVKKSEFLYIYDKNNLNKPDAYTLPSLEEYLELYINFKLKVKEAEEMGIDTLNEIKKELATYRKQLAKSYMVDREVNERMLKEAYERLGEEVHASHILINVSPGAVAEDTLAAYNKIMALKKEAKKGDFAALAKRESQDPSAKENGGDLGYFTALQMVYPFENAAYSTPVGQLSEPVRTRFGYHLIKVHERRKSRGQILVAHIFMKTPKDAQPEKVEEVKKRIDDVYSQLQGGADFGQLARRFSEDKTSASRGGELPWFGAGRMVAAFEDAAFGIAKDGDYTAPIQTDYGWHIIKRLQKKDLPPYEEIKPEIKKKIERDSRSEVSQKLFLNKIQMENQFKEYKENVDKVIESIPETMMVGSFRAESLKDMNKPVFSMQDKQYTQYDFAEYVQSAQKRRMKGTKTERLNSLYEEFMKESCLAYEESQLEKKYPDFKALMSEYRDGILLFELTDRKVWSKAVNDTAGLKKFYEANKGRYMWGDRIRATVFRCLNEDIANQAHAMLEENKSNEEILKSINTDESPNAIRVEDDGTFEKQQNVVIDQILWKMGVSKNVKREDGGYNIVKVTGLFEAQPKSLAEAKGYVVADYQESLEKEWLNELRGKYPVKVNKEVLKSMVKK